MTQEVEPEQDQTSQDERLFQRRRSEDTPVEQGRRPQRPGPFWPLFSDGLLERVTGVVSRECVSTGWRPLGRKSDMKNLPACRRD